VLEDVLSGKKVGTLFKAMEKMPSRKRWIAYGSSIKGKLTINEGARLAIARGASLLPVGITKVSGVFGVGDVVSLVDSEGAELARGIANYTSEEANLIKGVKTNRIESILGYLRRKEIVGRKYMSLMEEKA
jgi:glutamate 5-kinase